MVAAWALARAARAEIRKTRVKNMIAVLIRNKETARGLFNVGEFSSHNISFPGSSESYVFPQHHTWYQEKHTNNSR